eukprot:TRINITY_DN6825_c0_g1_i2.p1 TRINITY_DN6825_c0_g1~~TRINITY_DN6825_c0_g1_i2.p1  ORF type:complete len:1290 (+),score=619.19 TRINITY_DN6825_c0_g1_i2:80-3871(+)
METEANTIYQDMFAPVLKLAKSKEPADQHILATLEAATTYIRSQNGKLVPAAFFGLLMNHLETGMDSKTQTPESTSSTLYLLTRVFPKLAPSVIANKLSLIAEVLFKVHNRYYADPHQALLKSHLICIEQVLLSLKGTPAIAQREALKLFESAMSFVTDQRAKVRKQSHQAVETVLKEAGTPGKKALTELAATLCRGLLKKELDAPKNSEYSTLLQLLGLIKRILPMFSVKTTTDVCEALFAASRNQDPLVTTYCLDCFQGLFASPAEGEAEATPLPAAFLRQLISSLFEMRPNASDVNPMLSYVKTMSAAAIQLHRVDPAASGSTLPGFFTSLFSNFASDSDEVASATATALKDIIAECVDETMIAAAVAAPTVIKSKRAAAADSTTPLQQIIATLETGLLLTYKGSWQYVLDVQATLAQTLGRRAHPLLVPMLRAIDDVHQGGENLPAQLTDALDDTLRAFVTAMGPEKFLSVLPLNIEENEATKTNRLRAWLLPLLKPAIKHAELLFFAQYFVPLAQRLKERFAVAKQKGLSMEAQNLQILYLQVWDLWGSFTVYPTDLPQSFKFVAKTLGDKITEEPDLRRTVCAGLAALVERSRVLAFSEELPDFGRGLAVPTQAQGTENVAALAVFAKNFLPCLFNVFGASTAADQHAAVQRAIEAYVSITDHKLLNQFFKNVVSKLLAATTKDPNDADAKDKDSMETDKADERKKQSYSLCELTIPFVKHLEIDNVNFLYKVITPMLQDSDAVLQKRAFQILLAICESHASFVQKRLEDLKEVLIDTLANCSSAAKKSRLRCLKQVVLRLHQDQLSELPTLLGDVILCTKEPNAKTRDAAYSVLIEMGNRMADSVGEFFRMVVAGLAGTTPHMISATIVAISRLVFEFKAQLEPSFLHQLMEPMLTLMGSGNREIIKSAFGFIKLTVTSLPAEFVEKHLEALVAAVSGMPKEIKFHFRMAIRLLFQKLIRHYGHDRIHALVPEEDHKLINHIRREEARAKKKKHGGDKDKSDANKKKKSDISKSLTFEQALEAESDSEDEEEAAPATKGGKGEKMPAWLLEQEEDEPIDFLDPKAIRSVVSTKPGQPARPKKGHGFNVNDQGKFVIDDDEPGAKRKKAAGVKSELTAADYEQMIVDQESELDRKQTWAGKTKKRKQRDDDDEAAESEAKQQPTPGRPRIPQPPASGRPAAVAKKAKFSGQDYAAKKAGGDVKKAGQQEPFAYVPFNLADLNRRNKHKSMGQFKSIVRGAQKGAKAKSRAAQRRPKK